MTAHERLQQIAHIAASAPRLDGAESWHELRTKCNLLIDALAAAQTLAGGYDLMLGREPVPDSDFERLKMAIKGVQQTLEGLQQQHIKQTGVRL